MQTHNTRQTPEDIPLSPDEIKAIGEIELGPAKHEVFLNKHYKKLIAGGIALAIIATAATAWYAYGEQQVEEAGALIVKAVGSTAVDTSLSVNNYDVEPLNTVMAEYEGTPSVETAALLKAMHEMADPAHTDFSVLVNLAESAENDMIRLRAAVALATRFTSDGDYDKASKYWTQVINMPRNVYTPRAYVNLCDIAWNQGKTEQAAGFLRMARAACADSPLFATGANNDIAVRSDLIESGVDSPEIIAAPAAPLPDLPAEDAPLPEIPQTESTELPSLSNPSTIPAV